MSVKIKKMIYYMVIIILVCTTLPTYFLIYPNASEELIANGDFEKGTGWEDWGGFSFTSDSNNIYNGKAAGVVKQREGGAGSYIIQGVQPKEMFRFSGCGKVDGEGQEGILGIECLDSNGKKIKGGRSILIFNRSTYEDKSLIFYTVPGTAQLQVYIYVINLVDGGGAYFDKISLTRVEVKKDLNINNGAFLPPDWFNSFQDNKDIEKYVTELKDKRIKYQFVDIGLLNNDGTMDSKNYIALGQWIQNSKKIDSEQSIIGVLNYNRRVYIDEEGNKIPNPEFGTETFKTNIDALTNKLVNDGIKIQDTPYRLDGICIDFEGFVNDDPKLLECLRFLRNHSLSNNKYLSVLAPTNYSYDKTWSNGYIRDVAGVVNQINPMLYDFMGRQSYIDDQESYQTICRLELKRFSDAIGNISPNQKRCSLFPIIPSYERRIEKDSLVVYHDPQVENLLSAINAVKEANGSGANIGGVGIFWWPNFMGHYPDLYPSSYYLIDQFNWMTYWVNAS